MAYLFFMLMVGAWLLASAIALTVCVILYIWNSSREAWHRFERRVRDIT